MTRSTADARALIAWAIAMTALAVILLWAAYQVRHVLLLVYISLLFAIGFGPIVRAVERLPVLHIGARRLPRWVAILALYLVVLCAIAALVTAILPPLVAQARDFGARLPDMVDRGQQFLMDRGLLDHKLTWQEALQRAPTSVAGVGGDAVTTVFGALAGVAGGLVGLVTILILTFYMLVESQSLFTGFMRLFPRRERARLTAVSREITIKVSAWLGGQLLLGLVIGTTATIGLWLLGIPFFFVLGLVAGIGELIPMVGPILSAIPAVLVALSVSPGKALAVAIFFLLQQQFENHVLVPKVMSKQVGVSAVTVLVALLVGGSLLGIVGALLAVPTAAMLQVILEELTADADDTGNEKLETRK
jgi:predicted PurR-regulated permease PerM